MLLGFLMNAQTANSHIIISGNILEISIEKTTGGYKYSFIQSNETDKPESYNTISLSKEMLLSLTLSAFKEINGIIKPKDSTIIKNKIDIVFIELVANLFNEDVDGPVIATIELKEVIPVYTVYDSIPTHKLTPSKCYVVFKDGFIEQIKVFGQVTIDTEIISNKEYKEFNQRQIGKHKFIIENNESYGFTNIYSIGISSVSNIKVLNRTIAHIDRSKEKAAGYIRVGEAVEYELIPRQGTRDFSPSNSEIELVKGQKTDLFKASNKKLLEFKVFTDLVGMWQDNPNGLVQLELETRVPINTRRFGAINRAGFSFGSYIDFDFTLSKIENKVKYLELNSFIPTQQATTEYYIDALQVYRYQIFQIGSKLNLWLLESQTLKFDFEINLHGNFGYARVVDTILYENENINIDAPLNSIMWAPEIKFIFYPEKRINISLSDKITRQYFLYEDNKFEYGSIKDNNLVEGSKWFNTIGIDAYYWPSDQGKIFIRYRLNHELENISSNFSQFQIGYSMNINTSKEDN